MHHQCNHDCVNCKTPCKCPECGKPVINLRGGLQVCSSILEAQKQKKSVKCFWTNVIEEEK